MQTTQNAPFGSPLFDLTYISQSDDEPATIYTPFSGQLNFSTVKSVSVSKVDCNFNNTLPCFVVPLPSPYTGTPDETNGFQTIYTVFINYVEGGEVKQASSPVFWKNSSFNVSDVPFDGSDYDNFHDYFKIYKFKPILDAINETTKALFKQYVLNGAADDAVSIVPNFDANGDVLHLYVPLDNNTVRFHNKFNPQKVSASSSGDYCIGYCQEIARDFCRAFNMMRLPENANQPLGRKIFFIDEIPTFTTLNGIDIIKPGTAEKETYYIYSLSDAHYYEYTNYIQCLVIASSQIPTAPMFINCNTLRSFKLITNSNQIDNSFNALLKLNINHSQEQTSRLIYSNANILGNGIKVYGSTNLSNISVSLYTIDKYMNLRPLQLNKYDTVNVSLTLNY